MNIDAKIINTILTNQIQQCHIYILYIYYDPGGFITVMQVWYQHLKIKFILSTKKNHLIISIDTGKVFDKIQHPFMIKDCEH